MLKNTGKKIKRIRICKEKVVIYFFDQTKLSISHDTYASFYFFPNKELSAQELKEIKDLNGTSLLLNEALKLLKKSVMSEQKVREKLLTKSTNRKKIESVIKSLKEHDLISDEAYVADFLIYAQEKKMGKYKIINELIKRGIRPEMAKKVVFKEHEELKKALSLLPILLRRYASRNDQAKKEAIFNYLLMRGYSSEIAHNVVKEIRYNEKKENDFLERDFELLYLRLSSRFEGRELFEKVNEQLRKKGYKYNAIKLKWEEKDFENN